MTIHILEILKAHIEIGTQGWREASALNDKINDLMKRAYNRGWPCLEDKKFQGLDDKNAFHRADGPSSIITYLEGVLDRIK